MQNAILELCLSFQDDSMTDEAIKKAEEELQVPSKTPKINRDIALTTSGTEDTNASVLNKDENPLKGQHGDRWLSQS